MLEVIASLLGAIVGSAITLLCANWHEKSAQKRERQILQEALLEECQLQGALLEGLDGQYAQSQRVNPARVSIDLFVHALNRHVDVLGDVKLIQKLSQVVVHAKALNTALDHYESTLLRAVEIPQWLSNVERLRMSICSNIRLCKRVVDELKAEVQSGKHGG